MRMAEGIREGRSVSPDFDVAVKRHQLLDVIQKASDTGIRQISLATVRGIFAQRRVSGAAMLVLLRSEI